MMRAFTACQYSCPSFPLISVSVNLVRRKWKWFFFGNLEPRFYMEVSEAIRRGCYIIIPLVLKFYTSLPNLKPSMPSCPKKILYVLPCTFRIQHSLLNNHHLKTTLKAAGSICHPTGASRELAFDHLRPAPACRNAYPQNMDSNALHSLGLDAKPAILES